MAVAEKTPQTSPDTRAEVRAWLEDNWDPDLTVGEWWERLAEAGWATPAWPEEWMGRGLGRSDAAQVSAEIAEFGALGPPGGLGLMLAGPTIIAHGTDEQKARYLPAIAKGQEAWCQLFSEPGAGSDLAGLQSRAVKDGDEWVVTGQKVWTSGGHSADLGMLLARTDPSVPKHKGISYFALPMDQPGIDVRPLREMTGRALFSEVFIDEARVADDALIGGLNQGWAAAMTTLANERAGLGGGGGSEATSLALPGQKAGQLERRAGEFAAKGTRGTGTALAGRGHRLLMQVARDLGRNDDPVVRQDLMRLYTLDKIAGWAVRRAKADAAAGRATGGEANVAKLMMTHITRLSREVGLEILGASGMLMGPETPSGGIVQELALFSPAVSIYGGTDQVQRNILGERALGLPREPRPDKDVAFSELKVGTQG